MRGGDGFTRQQVGHQDSALITNGVRFDTDSHQGSRAYKRRRESKHRDSSAQGGEEEHTHTGIGKKATVWVGPNNIGITGDLINGFGYTSDLINGNRHNGPIRGGGSLRGGNDIKVIAMQNTNSGTGG